MPECVLPPIQTNQAFLAAAPLIQQQILNFSLQSPSFLAEFWDLEEFPLGNGRYAKQLIFRGGMPKIERGFEAWKALPNNTGCDPCDPGGCGYNWTKFGGHGFEVKMTELLKRDFYSDGYCLDDIVTTADFQSVFEQIVTNLYQQIKFFKEQNIGLNTLTGIAKKFVVDSGGAKPNTGNVYVYPNIGSARLSMLNIEIFMFFYEWMTRIPGVVPIGYTQGMPTYGAMASGELWARLYRDDPQLRQDVRFSSEADGLVNRYNFIYTIRDMFVPVSIQWPRRFNIVEGEPVEVLPTINDVPLEVGSYSSVNPAYMSATHEEVLIFGKSPFKILYQAMPETLGSGTSFGPEPVFMNNWQWINPMTNQDPFRRVGYFATSARMGISQQYSEGVFGILVERVSPRIMGSWLPAPSCPPTDPSCDNEIPATGCPQPVVLGWSESPFTANLWTIRLGLPTTGTPGDTLRLGLKSGGYVDGVITTVNADGTYVEVNITSGVDLGSYGCQEVTTLFCVNTLKCSSDVWEYNVVCTDTTQLTLTLANPIRADTAADQVTLFYGDGTSVPATVVSVDMVNNLWVVDLGGTAFCDQVGGVVYICTPTATDATCPACDLAPTFTQCEQDCGVIPSA